MTMTVAGPEQLKQRRRADICKLLDQRAPRQWVSRDGGTPHLRSGSPFYAVDAARLTGRRFRHGECSDCGRDAWVAYTDVKNADTAREKIRDLLACFWCGNMIDDDRPEVTESE